MKNLKKLIAWRWFPLLLAVLVLAVGTPVSYALTPVAELTGTVEIKSSVPNLVFYGSSDMSTPSHGFQFSFYPGDTISHQFWARNNGASTTQPLTLTLAPPTHVWGTAEVSLTDLGILEPSEFIGWWLTVYANPDAVSGNYSLTMVVNSP